MSWTILFSYAVFVVSLGMCLELWIGLRKIRYLRDEQPTTIRSWPKVSFIVSALNEGATIGPALGSVLALDYPSLEIIAVNDRSTDDTGAILDTLARAHGRLTVLHVETLPPGWLGKNHALHQGALRASGDYLLFSDADVVFAPQALRKAISYCERHQLDHLTLAVEIIASDHLLRMMIAQFAALFFLRFKPWKVRRSRHYAVGAGAFNLVRRSAYDAIGGHAAFPFAVIDDMTLAKLLWLQGFKQDLLAANDMVKVVWYDSVRDMFYGLKKNLYAGFNYQLWRLTGASAVVLSLAIWPWLGTVLTEGPERWINLGSLIASLLMYLRITHAAKWNPVCLLYWPVISIVTLALWWNASLSTIVRRGIDWRGTRYALSDLKRAHVKI